MTQLCFPSAGRAGMCSNHCSHARVCCGVQGYNLWSQAQGPTARPEGKAPSAFTSMSDTEYGKFPLPLVAHRAFQYGSAKPHPWLDSKLPAQELLDMGAAVLRCQCPHSVPAPPQRDTRLTLPTTPPSPGLCSRAALGQPGNAGQSG